MPRLTSLSLKTSRAAVTRSSVSASSRTPFSPAQLIFALVPRKSNRCDSSLPAWLSALSISWRSTLLTTSKDASAMALPLSCSDGRLGGPSTPSDVLYSPPVPPHGGLPERPMGADCKSVGLAYEGSNPSPATPGPAAPDLLRSGAVAVSVPSAGAGRRSRDRRRPRARDGSALQRAAAQEQPAEGDLDRARAAHRDLHPVGLGRPAVELRAAVGQLVGHGRLRRRAGEW